MTENDSGQTGRKQTLCQKYGITDSQLDFDYIGKCNNPVELERILKVLRSNEVGSFQSLEEATEQRLRQLAPDSRTLITPQPVLSWGEINEDQRNELTRDYLNWNPDGDCPSSQELRKEAKENPRNFPGIRNKTKSFFDETSFKKETKSFPAKSCVPRSYESWNDYNVEKELSLMDRDEELNQNDAIRAKNEMDQYQQEKSMKTVGLEETGGGLEHRRDAAENERLKGNEDYREGNYLGAIEHYTKSINLFENVESYNNRAQCYLKIKKFMEVLVDADKVISLSKDPLALKKARYRRSCAFDELALHKQAYEEISKALLIDPNDKTIQKQANELKAKLTDYCPNSKTVRMTIQDNNAGRSKPLIEEITQTDKYYPFTNSSDSLPLSDIGTARSMCRCNGTPPFIAKLRSAENLSTNNRLCLRKIRPKSSLKEKMKPKAVASKNILTSGLVNGEIVEKDTIEDVEKLLGNEEMQKNHTATSNLLRSLESDDFDSVVEEFAVLRPSQVRGAISSTLNPAFLNLCVKALCVLLKDPSSWKNVEEHLVALAQYPLFRSIVKHLEKATKDALSERIGMIEEQGQRVSHVVTLYELHGALPPQV